jgi:hypothetical protein
MSVTSFIRIGSVKLRLLYTVGDRCIRKKETLTFSMKLETVEFQITFQENKPLQYSI